MTFQAKLDIALEMLAATGMRRSNYAPPIYRLLWRSGVPIPPPPFAGFTVNFLFQGIWFGLLWGALMWFLFWRHQSMSVTGAILAAGFGGALFGADMAGYWIYKARKLKLPAWSDLRPPSSVFE